MSNTNKKYGVKPEVLEQIKFTPRDTRLAKADTLIQGIISTPPEKWNEYQLEKAQHLKLNEWDAERLRRYMDTESSST